MSEYPAPLWRDPLFSPGDRFPLGPPRGVMDNCQEGPSGPTTRLPITAALADLLANGTTSC